MPSSPRTHIGEERCSAELCGTRLLGPLGDVATCKCKLHPCDPRRIFSPPGVKGDRCLATFGGAKTSTLWGDANESGFSAALCNPKSLASVIDATVDSASSLMGEMRSVDVNTGFASMGSMDDLDLKVTALRSPGGSLSSSSSPEESSWSKVPSGFRRLGFPRASGNRAELGCPSLRAALGQPTEGPRTRADVALFSQQGAGNAGVCIGPTPRSRRKR
mmetsp:Transcript_11654/g.31276  ORF Transcript_11654/g.31276 Transcript_11654/m.31276 type:complete len:218 (+) Transcript_11654:2288-2941(+)